MNNGLERFNLKDIIQLMVDDPSKAADRLDEMSAKLKEIANKLRSSKKEENPFTHTSGVSEIVRANVIGPDGKIKQHSTLGG